MKPRRLMAALSAITAIRVTGAMGAMGTIRAIRAIRSARAVRAVSVCTALLAGAAQAHLIDAQTGTLNIVGQGAYLVLSLPVSAFKGVDDDGDGALSSRELQAHAGTLHQQVLAGVRLRAGGAWLPLQGLLLSPSPAHGGEGAPATQIVAMGRFGLPTGAPPLKLQLALFGRRADEGRIVLTATRKPESQRLDFRPGRNTQALFVTELAAHAVGR